MNRRELPKELLKQINEVASYIANNLDDLIANNDWQRPWRNVPRCYNALTRHEFSFLNCLGFWHTMVRRQFDRPIWATEIQWGVRGRVVLSEELDRFTYGSKPRGGGLAPLWRTGNPADEPQDHPSGYDLFRCFNVQQTTGREIDDLHRPTVPHDKFVDLVKRTTGVEFVEGGDHACYDPDRDMLRMPLADMFMDLDGVNASEHYYGTLLHELVHATGHKTRLKRPQSADKQSAEYWLEELIAELGASQLSVDLGVSPFVRDDHIEYLTHYAHLLRADDYALPRAAAQAEKARNYLLAVAGNAVLRFHLPLRDEYSREEVLAVLRGRLPNPEQMLDVVFQRERTLDKVPRHKPGPLKAGESIFYRRGPKWKSDMNGVEDNVLIRYLAYALGVRRDPR